jgi:rubredoxin
VSPVSHDSGNAGERRNAAPSRDERRCPKCGEDVSLFDPTEEDWLNVDDYDEDEEVWACISCQWTEQADPDEAFEYHMANLEWLEQRLAAIQKDKP